MSNDYYVATVYPQDNTEAAPAELRTEHGSIEDGFDKLPALTGNANKIVVINSGGTAQTVTTAPVIGLQSATGLTLSTTTIANLTTTQIAFLTTCELPLLATHGGTGKASYAIGDLLYANTTTSLAALADVAVGSVLASGGVGVAPAYSTAPVINLANATGVALTTTAFAALTTSNIAFLQAASIPLSVVNGGTGSTSTSQISDVNALMVGSLTTSQIAVLQTSTTQNLSAALLAGLNTTQIATLQTTTTQALSAALFAGLNTTQVAALATANTFTADQTLGENAGIVLDATLSADGKYSGIVESGTSSAALAFGEVCYRVTATGKWALAKADVVGTSINELGMCVLAAGGADAATTMLLFGKIRADALFDTFTVGAPVYISAATAGKTVSTAPTGTTDFVVRQIGRAEDANTVFFRPSNDYITLA